ncbi:uncharacterized protein H6S33_003760 [Morchella sextelata]|uniref:uncharacterized protein n=1 Tax=Morchella sextelata TaxID=1174677 RepID=UPI001D0503BC|nr:uncharacterized protein H6S33_003760 [Morchella sextelata]KAH0606099.1 hypothetical protein H6S33_003760 [Morchella sextelata]
MNSDYIAVIPFLIHASSGMNCCPTVVEKDLGIPCRIPAIVAVADVLNGGDSSNTEVVNALIIKS